MKNFERKDKNERRRVLLSKNDELGYSLDNKKLPQSGDAVQTNGLGVIAKLGSITLKQVRAFIAVLVALSIIVPSLVIASIRVFASNTEQAQKRYVNELETVKTVTRTENPGEYNVHLEAYNTSEMIEYPATDIVLVLDLSGSMKDELRKEEYENLNTHTIFEEYRFGENVKKPGDIFSSKIIYNDLVDKGNSAHNEHLDFTLSENFKNNKYIEDPNAPGNYVYVAARYVGHALSLRDQTYTFYFVDSLGNEYESEPVNGYAKGLAQVSSIKFSLKNRVSPPEDDIQTEDFEIYSIWARKDDDYYTNSLNSTLWEYRDNLWIQDDNNVWCKVTLTRNPDSSDAIRYTYTFEDSDGHIHTAVQGNQEYGAGYGVFQGFKTYKYATDDQGNRIINPDGTYELEVVHAYDADSPDNYSVESRSLYYKRPSESYSLTRLQAMKESVEQFIIDVHSNAHLRNMDQRIGIVIFNNGSAVQIPLTDVRDEVDVNSMIDQLYRFSASGATQIDEGMEDAYEILSTQSSGRNKVTIAFTDGVPTNRNGNSYTVDAATRAIQHANNIENLKTDDNTSTVYSIGLFTGANSDQMHGSMFYHSGVFHDSTICTGEVGSKWGRSNIAGLTNSDMSDVDAAATNRFLNLLSSNYPTATSVGIRKMNSLLECWGGQGFEITENYQKSGENHYFGSQSSEELYNAFQSIANDIAIPENTLGDQTHFVDTVTDSFNIVGDVDVHVEAVDSTGTTWTRTDDSVTVDPDSLANKRIDVTGFDYSENYVAAPDTNPAGNYGKKVVVDFTIHTIEGFVGGNSVPTNGSDSGIYGSDDLLVEDFKVPLRDIDLNYSVEAEDQEVFLNRHADLMEMLNIPESVDGTTNKYANILYTVTDSETSDVVFSYLIPAGSSGENGTLSLSEQEVADLYPVLSDNKTYDVSCTVTPIYNGDAEQIEPEDTATVYIYKPVVTVEDQWKTRSEAQEGVDLQVESIVWKAEGKNDTKTDGPDVTYQVKNLTDSTQPATPIDDYIMDQTKDFQVYDFTIDGESFNYTTDYLCYVRKGVEGNEKYVIASEYEGTPSADIFEVLTDEDGNIIYQTDDQGNPTSTPVFVMETVSIEKTVTIEPRNNDDQANGDFVTFINSSDPVDTQTPRVNGEFTVYVTKPFAVKLQKVFTGSYAVVDDVTITIKDANNNTVAAHTFDADDFNGLTTELVLLKDNNDEAIQFECGENYTVTESFADLEKYNVSFAGTSTTGGTITDSQSDSVYTFTTNKEDDIVNVVVTNAWNSEYDPVVTGISENNHSNRVLLIALASTMTLSAGGYGMYRIKKND